MSSMKSFAMMVFISLLLSACSQDANSPRGFSFPQGDVEKGREVFLYTGCLSCHVIDGIQSDIAFEVNNPVLLGGEVTRIKTYGELVTAIINPSHKIAARYLPEGMTAEGKSLMRNYNDTLTVSQLIDLVTFLETRYELIEYTPTDYPAFYP